MGPYSNLFSMDKTEKIKVLLVEDVETLAMIVKETLDDEGFDTGGDDYLRKPFSMLELIARVKALAHRAGMRVAPRSADVIRIGAFCLDTTTQILTGPGGTSEELSNRETEILKMLVGNINSVVESKEILLRLWGDDTPCNLRSLWVFITRLRPRLAADPGVRIINARGHGYKLVVR